MKKLDVKSYPTSVSSLQKERSLEMNEDVFCIYFYRFTPKLATPDICHQKLWTVYLTRVSGVWFFTRSKIVLKLHGFLGLLVFLSQFVDYSW